MKKILHGYSLFRKKYATGDQSVMRYLAAHGQKPDIMIVACCDARVDPSLILQCSPGELFVVRNVANIVPPYECDEKHHGTSAALEFGVRYLQVRHLIIWGHSQCGGIAALLDKKRSDDDFISHWVSQIDTHTPYADENHCAKNALHLSFNNCLTFPWIKKRVDHHALQIHRWFFDIQSGEIFEYDVIKKEYQKLLGSEKYG